MAIGKITSVFLLLTVNTLCFSQQKPPIEAYPYNGYSDLHQKAIWLQEDLRKHNLYKGLVMPDVLQPPVGNEDLTTAHQEDGGNRSGPYLAALCYQHRVTGENLVKTWADETFAAIEFLEKVTGVPGMVARSYNRSSVPQAHEEWFFFPMEWHQSTSFPEYRWLGDPSSDTYSHLIYGLAVYHDLVADDGRKKRVSELVSRMVKREMDYGMRIVDLDGKTTLWGNYSPLLDKEKINYLLPLMHLKVAWHVSGDRSFEHKYFELIDKYQYADHAMLTVSYKPPYAFWDSKLSMEALYLLLKYEEDPNIRNKYLAALERAWVKEKDNNFTAFDVVYNHYVPEADGFTRKSIDDMSHWSRARRKEVDQYYRRQGDDDRVVGTWINVPVDYIRAYWKARYYKVLNEDGTIGVGNPPDWAKPPLDKYDGMVLIPAGSFIMGSEIGDDDEKPRREVYLDGYYIDRFEVSNELYARFDADHRFEAENNNDPVTDVSWYEADEYCRSIGKRLPTEAEWEKAARGTDGRKYPWGNIHDFSFSEPDGIADEAAWRAGKSPFGLYWTVGQAWEWTADWYVSNPPAIVQQEKYKVIKGGRWQGDPSHQRSAHKYYMDPASKISGYHIGIRCARGDE